MRRLFVVLLTFVLILNALGIVLAGAVGDALHEGVIAYVSITTTQRLLLLDVNRSLRYTLYTGANIIHVTWSADGRQLAFGTGGGIYVIDANGKNLQRMRAGNYALSPSWSPDGHAFICRASDTTGSYLVTVSLHGRQTQKVTDTPLNLDFPTWSPDGRTIAAVKANGHVVLLNIDGTQIRPLTDDVTVWMNERPVWSPDGAWLMFVGQEPSTNRIGLYRISADGIHQNSLVGTSALGIASPSWLPDGRRVLFNSYLPQYRWRMTIMDIATGQLDYIQTRNGEFPQYPAWRP